MTTLFNRYIGVTVGREGSVGRLFDNLKIEFRLERTTDSNANKGSISIYNLNEESRQIINDEGALYSISAGYSGINEEPLIGELSSGDIEEIKTEKKGVDLVTTFQTTEAGKALRNTTIDKSYAEGISKKAIIDDIVGTLGIVKGAIEGLSDTIFNGGYTASGKAKDRLDELTKNENLEWSVQNGELQILPEDGFTSEEAVFLTYSTGLLRAYKQKAENVDKIYFEALLNPDIKVGKRIQIESKEVSGIFVVRRAEYSGDNRSGQFMVKGEIQ